MKNTQAHVVGWVLGLLLSAAPLHVFAQDKDEEVRARAEALTTLMRQMPDKADEAQRTAKLDAYFDFTTLTQAPIAAHAKVLKGGDRNKLEQVFGRLVRHLAYASGDSMRRGEPRVANIVRNSGKRRKITDVAIKSADDDVDDQVSFVWEEHKSGWQVVDVELDGASVTKDYENQFGKIIKKDGPQGLLKRMQARLAQAEQGNKSVGPQ